MVETFNTHVRAAHGPRKKAPRAGVNQAAARVVREAIEKDHSSPSSPGNGNSSVAPFFG